MEKLLLMQVAATMAAGVATRLPQLAKSDQPKDNPDMQAEDLAEWEIFRIFYSALVQAVADEADWPGPQMQLLGPQTSNVIQQLIAKVPALGGILTPQVIQSILSGGTPPAPAPQAPVGPPSAAPAGSPSTQSTAVKR